MLVSRWQHPLSRLFNGQSAQTIANSFATDWILTVGITSYADIQFRINRSPIQRRAT